MGGPSGKGTVFAVNTDGTGFTSLYEFTNCTSDGYWPDARPLISGNTLYGTTTLGGSSGNGTVFAINLDGTGFTNLCSFPETYSPVGFQPCGLIMSGNALYGTTTEGGTVDIGSNGTVFSISFAPKLNITLAAENVVLTWPAHFAGFDYTGYTLQWATNLLSPVWSTDLPPPVVINGQNMVINPVSGAQQFYRLSQ